MQKNKTINRTKTKLLFITYTHSNGGGAEKLLTDYVNNLAQSGFDITVCEISHFDVKKEKLDSSIKILKPLLFHSKHYLYNFFFGFMNLKLLENNPNILKSVFHWTNYDVVITWNYQRPSFALNSFQKEGKIAWFHGDIYDLQVTTQSSEDLILKNRKQLEAWEIADKIITISKNSKKSLENVFPELKEKCEVINNGINIQYVIKQAAEKTDFIFEKDIKYLCCVGRLDYNKNFILAIKSLQIVLNRYNNCKLLIIGEGDQKIHLKEYIISNNLENNVIFLGYQNNPYKYMAHCDILCQTSFSEGWSLVTAEMMALGKTFVTTKVAGASDELACDNTCGLIADWNPKDYSDKILSILQNESLFKSLCNNSLQNINRFTVDESVKKIEEIITGVMPKEQMYYQHNNYFPYILFNTFIPALQDDWLKKKSYGKKLVLFFYRLIYYCFWGITIPIRFFLSMFYCFIK